MLKAIEKFRKKYTLTLLMFAAGTAHSFLNAWTASDFTHFCFLLLGVFGTADLIDKEKVGVLKPKGANAP